MKILGSPRKFKNAPNALENFLKFRKKRSEFSGKQL